MSEDSSKDMAGSGEGLISSASNSVLETEDEGKGCHAPYSGVDRVLHLPSLGC